MWAWRDKRCWVLIVSKHTGEELDREQIWTLVEATDESSSKPLANEGPRCKGHSFIYQGRTTENSLTTIALNRSSRLMLR